jgi:hypothetical protein
MVRKILILLSMVAFHVGCSGGGQTAAATPQPLIESSCNAGYESFEGAQEYGNSADVACLQSSTLANYGVVYRRHGHARGLLCRDERDTRCGARARCQPLSEQTYGFCMKR